MEDLTRRLERLEKRNLELQEALDRLAGNRPTLTFSATEEASAPPSATDVKAIVAEQLKERDAKKKADDAAAKKKADEEGFVVGKNLGMTVRWNNGLWFETADQAFKFNVGGRTQFDIVGVTADDAIINGNPGGIGAFDDAVNFRRARLDVDGSFHEVFNFYCQFDFVNTFDVGAPAGKGGQRGFVMNTPAPTDLWIEVARLPWIGNLRVGNQKPPIGFEHMTSSRFLNFLERSYGFDSFLENGNNGFTQGFQNYHWTENERATYAVGVFKNTRGPFAWNVGDGEWGPVGRATWLPYYEHEGRCLVHLGIGAQHFDLDDDIIRFRSRTMARNGPAVLHNIMAIARLVGDSQFLYNPELVVQIGPWSLQAEYTGTRIFGVTRVTDTPARKDYVPNLTSYFGQGAYVEALYFLTGEHREYNKKYPGFGRVVPYRNAYWIEGADGKRVCSPGAWQVGVRYSWLDLNNGDVIGGEINSLTLGLNWFLNPLFKIQWNYEVAHRSIPNGNASGIYQEFGTRFAFDF